jgi:hypothetical protein
MAKIGDIIKVKRANNGYYQIGTKYRLIMDYGPSGWLGETTTTPPVRVGSYIRETDFDVVYNKQKIAEDIEKLELKLESIKKKKNYLKKNKLKEIDTKSFSILEIVEEASRTDKSEKEKLKGVEYLIQEYNSW